MRYRNLCQKVTIDQPSVSKSEMECEDETVSERKVECETVSRCEGKKSMRGEVGS